MKERTLSRKGWQGWWDIPKKGKIPREKENRHKKSGSCSEKEVIQVPLQTNFQEPLDSTSYRYVGRLAVEFVGMRIGFWVGLLAGFLGGFAAAWVVRSVWGRLVPLT